MSEAYSTAFLLLFVGMITVFIILAMVTFAGKLIIYTVNKYIPELENENLNKRKDSMVINSKKLSAIVAAVDILTNGRARIDKIEKATN